jgi:hypothetical protein
LDRESPVYPGFIFWRVKKPGQTGLLKNSVLRKSSGVSSAQFERELPECRNAAIFRAAAPALQVASQVLA